MLALYRSGRQADALGAYRRARDELVDAIGVEPGPELRRLHEAILRQDPSLDLPAARRAAARARRRHAAGRPRGASSTRCASNGAARAAGDGAELARHRRRAGSARPGWRPSSPPRSQRDGAHVLYALGRRRARGGAPARSSRRARVRRPTLLVVDDLDHAPGEVAAELERVAVAGRPLLVLATVRATATERRR